MLFTIANIAAAEKRPLRYETPQSVHTPHGSKLWCSDLSTDNALQEGVKTGEGMVGF